jgi:hypothetical protein
MCSSYWLLPGLIAAIRRHVYASSTLQLSVPKAPGFGYTQSARPYIYPQLGPLNRAGAILDKVPRAFQMSTAA